MNTDQEYQQWKADPVAQQEYMNYLLEEKPKQDPEPPKIFDHFTCQFNEIFRKKP